MDSAAEQLKKMAIEQLGELTVAEQKLLVAAATGGLAKCGGASDGENDLGKAHEWANERTIRASLIGWLCTNRDALVLINSAGIRVLQARILGEVNLVGISVSFSLSLFACAIQDGINVQDASLRNLNLQGSLCGYLIGDRLTVSGSLFLRDGFTATGPVTLVGSSISGDFECSKGTFGPRWVLSESDQTRNVPEDLVLVFDRSNIEGRVFLNGFRAEGIVQMVEARINRSFDCVGAFMKIGINMRDAQSGSINFSGTTCPYVIADRLEVKGSMFLRDGFRSAGSVVLLRSTISGDLDCNGSFFGKSQESPAPRATAEANFGKNIPKGALEINGSTIGGYLFLADGFEAHGAVGCNGVNIGANLHCDGGRFFNAGVDALSCQFSLIRGAALFRKYRDDSPPFQTDGIVNFFGTSISGSMSFAGCEFLKNAKNGVTMQNASVAGTFRWKQIGLTANTRLDLSHFKVGQLEDDDQSWPSPGNLKLDGFCYNAIVGVPLDSHRRKSWLKSHLTYLKRQSKDDFSLQPYRQLGETLGRSGYEDNARQVMIDMHKARREQGGLSRWGWIWSLILQGTIGFGYRSHWAFGWALVFVLLGTGFFRAGYRNGLLVPTKLDATSVTEFSSLGYSLDTFLPIINLHQEEFWIPSGGSGAGRVLLVYYWLHICLGWALITLGVAGFTGLIRRE